MYTLHHLPAESLPFQVRDAHGDTVAGFASAVHGSGYLAAANLGASALAGLNRAAGVRAARGSVTELRDAAR